MLVRQTAYYMVAGVVSAILGLLSAVVFTRMLTPADYGVYIIGVSSAGIISAILFTWLRYSALRFQAEGGAVDIRATALLAYGLSALASPLAIAFLSLHSSVPVERASLAVLFALGLGLFELGQELLKARLQTRAFVTAAILRSLAAFALCLIAAWLGFGGLGQLAMAACAYFVTAAALGGQIWKGPLAPIDLGRLKTFARLGAPMTVAGFVFAFHAALDRLFVAWWLGDSAAGLYGASADLVRQMILLPASSVAAATIPLAIRAYTSEGPAATRLQLQKGAELLLAILLPSVVGLALVSPYLAELILGPAFRAMAVQIMPILAFAWLFQSMSQSYVHTSFHLAKRPELNVAHALATLFLNVLIIGPMINAFGLLGAAGSLAISEALGFVVGVGLTRRAHPLPMIPGPATRVAMATAFMGLTIYQLERLMPGKDAGAFAIVVAGGVGAYALACLAMDVFGCRAFAERLANRGLLATPAST